jgi:elongation factor P hydroxylase
MSAASQNKQALPKHSSAALEQAFDGCFRDSYGTVLVGGAPEPLYIPSASAPREPHKVLYRENYFASALHEAAHWCIAGSKRRKLDDYGYWYAPDGRSPLQQEEFERVEVRPQALEWIFSDACGWEFQLSADNLEGGAGASEAFARAVGAQRDAYLAEGLPMRATSFLTALESLLPR